MRPNLIAEAFVSHRASVLEILLSHPFRQQQYGVCCRSSLVWLDISPGNIIPRWVAFNFIDLATQ